MTFEPCESCGVGVEFRDGMFVEEPLGTGWMRPMPEHTPERCRGSRSGSRPEVPFELYIGDGPSVTIPEGGGGWYQLGGRAPFKYPGLKPNAQWLEPRPRPGDAQ